MRVWVISSSYPRHPGESINAGVLAREVAQGIAKLGHEVTVVTPDKPGGVVFEDDVEGVVIQWPRPTVALSDLNPRNPLEAVKAAALLVSGRRTIRRIAAESPPDAVVALWGLPSGIFARWAHKQTGAPYVTWLLGSDVWRADRLPGGKRTLSRVLEDATANFADGSELARRARADTGVDVSVLWSARTLPAVDATAEQADVLFVGRYHPNKGPDVLLEALAQLDDGVNFAFHGHGVLEAELRSKAAAMGRDAAQVIGGPISAAELSARLRSTQVLVIPSRIESVPLILGDAIQAGTPVVVTDVGDMGTVVERHNLGLVVPPEDPAAMAGAIGEMLANASFPSPEGLATAREQFSAEGIAAALLEPLAR